jgi:hypothetical protein
MRHFDPQVASTHTLSLSHTHTCARSSAYKNARGQMQDRAIKLQHMPVHVPCGISLQKQGADGSPVLVDHCQCSSPSSLCPRDASQCPFPLYFLFITHFTTPLTRQPTVLLGPSRGGWQVVYILVHEDDRTGLWPPPKSRRETPPLHLTPARLLQCVHVRQMQIGLHSAHASAAVDAQYLWAPACQLLATRLLWSKPCVLWSSCSCWYRSLNRIHHIHEQDKKSQGLRPTTHISRNDPRKIARRGLRGCCYRATRACASTQTDRLRYRGRPRRRS